MKVLVALPWCDNARRSLFTRTCTYLAVTVEHGRGYRYYQYVTGGVTPLEQRMFEAMKEAHAAADEHLNNLGVFLL